MGIAVGASLPSTLIVFAISTAATSQILTYASPLMLRASPSVQPTGKASIGRQQSIGAGGMRIASGGERLWRQLDDDMLDLALEDERHPAVFDDSRPGIAADVLVLGQRVFERRRLLDLAGAGFPVAATSSF
jgi:hypothetical protein